MTKFKDLLPQNYVQEFPSLVKEGETVAHASLQAALDTADSAAKSVATVVTMWRCLWLQSSGLPNEVQQMIQDLLFEGTLFFWEQTNSRLHSLKDSKATLKSLGLYMPAGSRKQYRLQQYRLLLSAS